MVADPTSAGPIVDDLLRLLSVVQVAFPRFVKRDVVIGGKQIAEGSVIVCSLAGGQPRPARDRRRRRSTSTARPSSHLAFGYGFHRCVGAELARMELKMAFPALAQRYPEMRLAVPTRGARLPRAQHGVRRRGRARHPGLTEPAGIGCLDQSGRPAFVVRPD